MNELEEKRLRLRQYELDVKDAEIDARQAKRDMELGIDQAQNVFDRECNKLKCAYETTLNALQKEQASLDFARKDAESFDGQ